MTVDSPCSNRLPSLKFVGDTLSVSTLIGLSRVQTTTDLAGSLPCFNPIGALIRCTLWSIPTGTKILSDDLITNSNLPQNIGEQKHTLYSLQPTIAHNEYLFHNSGNIQAIKLLQRISKHDVKCDVI